MRAAGMLAGEAGANVVIDRGRQVVNVLSKLSEDELRAIAAGQPARSANGRNRDVVSGPGKRDDTVIVNLSRKRAV